MEWVQTIYDEMHLPPVEEQKVEDVPMTEEELAEKKKEERRALLREKYAATFAKDKASMEGIRQRPLSRAYNSLNTASNTTDKTAAEEALTQADYQLDRSQKAKPKKEYFK